MCLNVWFLTSLVCFHQPAKPGPSPGRQASFFCFFFIIVLVLNDSLTASLYEHVFVCVCVCFGRSSGNELSDSC